MSGDGLGNRLRDDKSVIASLLATNAFGNLRSQTMLAYSVDEMKEITGMMKV